MADTSTFLRSELGKKLSGLGRMGHILLALLGPLLLTEASPATLPPTPTQNTTQHCFSPEHLSPAYRLLLLLFSSLLLFSVVVLLSSLIRI